MFEPLILGKLLVMFNPDCFEIIDISQPVSSATACFPGDVPFHFDLTLSFADSQVVNLTALTMSPHVGTHADAPAHIGGDLFDTQGVVGNLPLQPFLGETLLVDIAPWNTEIRLEHISSKLSDKLPARLLVRTKRQIRFDVFEDEYAYFAGDLLSELGRRGVRLLGIDTPSVDHVGSKKLPAHHALQTLGMVWLENLDLTKACAGKYFLVALPLKFMELEASPVRAVLLSSQEQALAAGGFKDVQS